VVTFSRSPSSFNTTLRGRLTLNLSAVLRPTSTGEVLGDLFRDKIAGLQEEVNWEWAGHPLCYAIKDRKPGRLPEEADTRGRFPFSR